MKFTLKNRPDVHEWYYRKQVHDWFEGFEKELRERLKKNDPSSPLDAGELYFIKEVLGE